MKSRVSFECDVWEWRETPRRKALMAGRWFQAQRMEAPRVLAGRRVVTACCIRPRLPCLVYSGMDSM